MQFHTKAQVLDINEFGQIKTASSDALAATLTPYFEINLFVLVSLDYLIVLELFDKTKHWFALLVQLLLTFKQNLTV